MKQSVRGLAKKNGKMGKARVSGDRGGDHQLGVPTKVLKSDNRITMPPVELFGK